MGILPESSEWTGARLTLSSFLLCSDLYIIQDGGEMIGDPVLILIERLAQESETEIDVPTAERIHGLLSLRSEPAGSELTPIALLNPFLARWTIQATVAFSSKVRRFTRGRIEARCFSVHFKDSTVNRTAWS